MNSKTRGRKAQSTNDQKNRRRQRSDGNYSSNDGNRYEKDRYGDDFESGFERYQDWRDSYDDNVHPGSREHRWENSQDENTGGWRNSNYYENKSAYGRNSLRDQNYRDYEPNQYDYTNSQGPYFENRYQQDRRYSGYEERSQRNNPLDGSNEETENSNQFTGEFRGKGPKGYKRPDERILEEINDRLTDEALLDASEIEVKVENGEVTLTGTVTRRTDKRIAEDIAEAVSGVTNVENLLRINKNVAAQEKDFSREGFSEAGRKKQKSESLN